MIPEQLYRVQKMHLEADLIERAGDMKPEARGRIEALLKKMAEEEARYNKVGSLKHQLTGPNLQV